MTMGQRLRHLRRSRGLTLAELGDRVGRAPSALSLLENGRREPKFSVLEDLASALSVPVEELLRRQAPSRRAQLEITLEELQRDPAYAELGLPHLKLGTRVPTEVLEHLVKLAGALREQRGKPAATPEEARAANAELRAAMRERANYFEEIEQAAYGALQATGYAGGALSQGMLMSVVSRHGFSVRYAQDLPNSVRSLTDLRNHRIYVKKEPVGTHSPRAVLLQALGHFLLGHEEPRDFADFLRQRVESNYFAAAVLMPERAAVRFLADAKQARDLAVEDLVDVFSVSYEMAAHRFTNLATRHLDMPCHFTKNDSSGIIFKAYESDGLVFPADPVGAIEGQRMCRKWAGRQVFSAADPFPRTTSTRPHRRARSSASRRWTPGPTGGSPSRWAFRMSTRAGSAAATRPSGCARPARTASAASGRRPSWRRAGRAWRGPRRGRTHTCCPRYRRAASPGSTRRTSTNFSTGTPVPRP